MRSCNADVLNYNETQNRWVSGLCTSSGILNIYKAQRFGNWICIRPQVRGREHLICWVPLKKLTSVTESLDRCQSQNQSYMTTDSLSVSPSWYQDPRPISPILSLIIFHWPFRVCWWGAPSLTRSRVTQPFSNLNPTGLMGIVYCLYFWDSPNQEGQVPVFISPRKMVTQLYPRA
jgi:hypothetical protein